MIYRLEKAVSEGLKLTRNNSSDATRTKMYSTKMTARLAVPMHPTLAKTGKYNTGLTKQQEGELEVLMGHEPGTLSDKSTFWKTFGIIVPAQGLVLNDDIPEEALMIAVLKGRKETVGDIALTKADIRTNANAKWLLSNDESEAIVKATSLSQLAQAAVKYDSMNLEDMENYLKSKHIDTRGMSSNIIKGKVAEDVTSSPKRFLTIATDRYQADKIFIHELLAYGILKLNKNSYISEDGNTIAYSQQEMLDFINNKINAKAVIALRKQLEEYKK